MSSRPRGLLYTGLTAAIALAVVGGAGYFSWTVYVGGSAAAVEDETIPLIVAALEDYKTEPEDPGGITAPGGDFAFYSEMEGRPPEIRPGEERVLPPPESPIDQLVPELFDRPIPPAMPVDQGERQSEPGAEPVRVAEASAQPGVTVPPALTTPMLPLPAIDEGQITPEPVSLPTSAPAPEAQVADVILATDPAPAPAASTSTVQLASMRSAAAADEEARRLRRLLPDLLASRAPIIRESSSNGTTYFRVIFPANGPIDAAALCSEIKSRDLDCIVHN